MNDLDIFLVFYYAVFAGGLILLGTFAMNKDAKRKQKRLQIAKDILNSMRGKENISESEINSLHRRYDNIFKVPGRWSTRESILFGHVSERIDKKRRVALGLKPQ